MNEYWQNKAAALIAASEQPGFFTDTEDGPADVRMAKWIGQAQAVMTEALRIEHAS